LRAFGTTGEGRGGDGEDGSGRKGALASAKPREERFVSGVPPACSMGGAGGLPDLPREGRGRGVVSDDLDSPETRRFELSFGLRGMHPLYGARGAPTQANRAASLGQPSCIANIRHLMRARVRAGVRTQWRHSPFHGWAPPCPLARIWPPR
jgi:hypothetical protein